jgi:hypothetical protein
VFTEVLNAINSKKTSLNPRDLLKDYFTSEYPLLPQHMDFYKFKIGERVGIDLSRGQRLNLTYQYSLYYGRMNKSTTGVIISRRLDTIHNKYFTPFYTVRLADTKVKQVTKRIHKFIRAHIFILRLSACAQFNFDP